MRHINIKKITVIYILVYFIIAGMYCSTNGIRLRGEWDDYSYPVVTLMTKHTISIYEEDIPTIKEYFPEWSNAIDSRGIVQLSGRHTRNGGTLTWYFPTYALVCIPMVVLLRFLGLSATYAFCFTNLAAVMLLLIVVYKYLQAGDKSKLALIVLLSINPVMFYYEWVSAECVIYALLGISLVFWYNKQYKRAAFFVSLAGTLNITIMSIGIIMIMEYMLKLFMEKQREISWFQYFRENVLRVISYGACYIVGLIPMVYFYYNTGYINLTASYESFTSGREAVWHRFLAYVFDLNFGILPYFPVILILGIILLVMACFRKHWRYIEWFIAFIVNVVLYSFMKHINCGMAGMSRYNTWGVLILLFAVCLFSTEIMKGKVSKRIISIGACINVGILALIIYTYGPSDASNTNYLRWTPIAQFVLDHYPGVYNPLHSTFNSRTVHKDGGYVYETPVVYTADDGYVRKILATEEDAEYIKQNYMSLTDNSWLQEKVNALTSKEKYISIPEKYKVVKCARYSLNEDIYFQTGNNTADLYMTAGMSHTEVWGTWSLGNEVEMRFRTESSADSLHGLIECRVFNGKQTYRIYVNDVLVSEGVAEGQNLEFDFDNPGADKIIEIRIELPDAESPKNLGQSEDSRVLAIGFKRMVFTEN